MPSTFKYTNMAKVKKHKADSGLWSDKFEKIRTKKLKVDWRECYNQEQVQRQAIEKSRDCYRNAYRFAVGGYTGLFALIVIYTAWMISF